MYKLLLAPAALAVTLIGCTGETDPRRAGFLDSLANQTDGTYDQRLEERRQRNANQAALNAQVAADTQQLEAERSRLERRVSSTRAKISSLETRIASAKRNLAPSSPQYVRLTAAEQSLQREEAVLEQAAVRGDEDAVAVQLRKVGLIEEELAL